jgi:nitrate reductase molybdenum cofactor assembly chaperone NarJ/NarW
MKSNSLTLRALARLLGYPDAALRSVLPQLADVVDSEAALPAARRAEIRALAAALHRADPIGAAGRRCTSSSTCTAIRATAARP